MTLLEEWEKEAKLEEYKWKQIVKFYSSHAISANMFIGGLQEIWNLANKPGTWEEDKQKSLRRISIIASSLSNELELHRIARLEEIPTEN